MFDQMVGPKARKQIALAMRIITAALVVTALSLVVIAVCSVIGVA